MHADPEGNADRGLSYRAKDQLSVVRPGAMVGHQLVPAVVLLHRFSPQTL